MLPPQAALHGQFVGLGRNGQAWSTTKTDKQVLLRTACGWQNITLPVAPAAGDSVAVNGDTIVAVGFQAGNMVVQSSPDLGRTWSTKTVPSAQPSAYANVVMSPATGRFVAGAQVMDSLGAGGGSGPGIIGDPSSGMVQAIDVPGDARDAGWAGNALVAPDNGFGGTGTRLFRSDDFGATWTDLTKAITGADPPDHDTPLDTPYFGPALTLGDGTAIVLEETTPGSGVSVRVLRFSGDGSHGEIATLSVPGNVGIGPIPVLASTYGADGVIVAAFDSPTFQVVTEDGTVSTISAAGLPAAPGAMSFQDATNGLAQVTMSSCANGKTDCTSTTTTYATTDGGHSWVAV
ncbi:MAG: hypothetical protein FWC46_08520 [Actinomycetia bacterium]|nr:hypothetical protein [Actinomycetes bacterium]